MGGKLNKFNNKFSGLDIYFSGLIPKSELRENSPI